MAAVQQLTLEGLGRQIDTLAKKVSNLSFEKPLRIVSVLLASAAKQSFDQSVTPDGIPWVPLKRPSARRGGPSSRPLRDTGLLMASLTARGSGHVENVTKFQLVWGTNVHYAGYHQRGTRTIPARPFLGISTRTAQKIRMICTDHVTGQVKV